MFSISGIIFIANMDYNLNSSSKVEFHNAKNAQISAPKSVKSRRHPLGKAFDGLNGIIANLLLHLTSSVRFPGSLNGKDTSIRIFSNYMSYCILSLEKCTGSDVF